MPIYKVVIATFSKGYRIISMIGDRKHVPQFGIRFGAEMKIYILCPASDHWVDDKYYFLAYR